MATGLTTLVVLVAKFVEGAWITALLIVVMIVLMRAVKRHYVRVARETDLTRPLFPPKSRSRSWCCRSTAGAASRRRRFPLAWRMSSDIRCVHVLTSDDFDPFCDSWQELIAKPLRAAGRGVPRLITLKSPYRYVLQPVVDYVLNVEKEPGTCKVCVLVPELVVRHWWEGLLHNRRSDLLKFMLLMRGNRRIVVINIPWYLEEG